MVNFDKLSAEVEMFQENVKRTRRTIKDEDEERRLKEKEQKEEE